MLRFEQIGEDTPKNIMVVTDDANAEMAAISETMENGEFDAEDWETVRNLDDAERDDDGMFRFVVVGSEAGEIGDYWTELDEFLAKCNAEALEAAEKAQAEAS